MKDNERIGQKLRGVGMFLVKLRPSLAHELRSLDIEIEAYQYAAGAFVSAFMRTRPH